VGEARDRAERLLKDSEEARRVFDAMRSPRLGAWLAQVVPPSAGAADEIADRVMAKLEAAQDSPHGGVVRRMGLGARDRSRFQKRAVAVTGVLTLAAAVAMYARFVVDSSDGSRSAPVASAPLPQAEEPRSSGGMAQPPGAVTRAEGAAAQGVEVDEIDSPGHRVSVFEIPATGAAAMAGTGSPSSVVVWIEDDRGLK
jgi:hypothetical protein